MEMERGPLPLADRRSRQFGILLLRRQGADQPALLRVSLADRLSAGRRPPPPATEADAVRLRTHRCRPRARGAHNHKCWWLDSAGASALAKLRPVAIGPCFHRDDDRL